jgi:predicted DNA-binding transcriptional regulator AlpA
MPSPKITISDVCADLNISRSTFNDWRAKGDAPHCIKLPNGKIRIRLETYEAWLKTREDAA